MSTALNVHLLRPEELIKYTTPISELEKAQAEAIRQLVEAVDTHDDQTKKLEENYSAERSDRERYEEFYDKILEHFEFLTKPWFAPEPDDEPLVEAIKDLMTGERPAPKQVEPLPEEPPPLDRDWHDQID